MSAQGVPQDYNAAMELFRLSAAQKNPDGQYNLGLMYQNGLGVPRDYDEAVNLFRLAAAQGKASAQYSLGLMYSLGHGVPQDYVRSHMWLTTSKTKTNTLLLSVVPKMTPAQVELALKMAKRCEESNYKQCDEPEGDDDSKSLHQFAPLKKLVE